MQIMNNKKLNTMVYGLGMLAILALGTIILPLEALADRAGYITPYGSTHFPSVSSNNSYNTYTSPNTTDNSYTTPTVYSNNPNTNTSNTSTSTSKNTSSTTKNTNTNPTKEVSDLSANAIYGTNGWLPSGLIQWIILAILILIVVILVRKVTGAEDKYHKEPLKHA